MRIWKLVPEGNCRGMFLRSGMTFATFGRRPPPRHNARDYPTLVLGRPAAAWIGDASFKVAIARALGLVVAPEEKVTA